ncbi:MAG: formylmethanofuran dehydrogenase subunit C [Candidatus Bathyarchaeia archaeon]
MKLTPKVSLKVSVEAEVINPNVFAGKSLEEIANLPVWEGRIKSRLGDFFELEGPVAHKPEDVTILIDGDASRVKYIGARMTAGEVIVKGNVDMHTGDMMKGGRIIIEGNADSFTALSMRGGEIIIKGSAGDYLGAAPRGEWRGMMNGRIFVEGNAGREIGAWMMGGLIHVKGNVGQFAGVHMRGGTILVEGNAGARAGAQMVDGKIIILGKLEELLPGFVYKETVDNIKLDDATEVKGPFLRFEGDLAEDGKGSLYLHSNKNQHLMKQG